MQTFLFLSILNLGQTRLCLLSLCICLTILGSAQMMDSIQSDLTDPAKFTFRLDARNSFVTSTSTKVKGIKLGVSHNRTFGYGVGYSWMSNDFYVNLDSSNLRMNYASAYVDYTFYKSNRWKLELPIQLGVGKVYYRELNKNISENGWVTIWEPAMTMEYIFLKYFGVGFGTGYRLVFKSANPIKERFTAPIYMFKFKIYFDKIYYDIID